MVNNAQSIAVSQILKFKSVGEGEPMKKSREDWRKAKELEEARKAGTAPAALDEEDKDINPHISHYITTAPWYYGTSEPTLKHQRPQDDKQTEYSHLAERYSRGVDTTNIVTKYRKGVCQNCGAVIHKKKFCMERPRKVGAKFSGSNIAYDGGESLEAPPKSLLLAQTEDYTEYSRSRKFIKKQDKEVIKSKYEDVYINNHTSVWCSYWKGGQWGYKCCHSFVKNSYCLGEAGRSVSSVKLETIKVEENSSSDKSEETEKPDNGSSGGYVSSSSEDEKIEKKKQKERKNKRSEAKDKLKEVLKAEEESKARADKLLAMNERKRPYNSMFEVKKPTDEEMEAYYLKRRREEDPMSQFM